MPVNSAKAQKQLDTHLTAESKVHGVCNHLESFKSTKKVKETVSKIPKPVIVAQDPKYSKVAQKDPKRRNNPL